MRRVIRAAVRAALTTALSDDAIPWIFSSKTAEELADLRRRVGATLVELGLMADAGARRVAANVTFPPVSTLDWVILRDRLVRDIMEALAAAGVIADAWRPVIQMKRLERGQWVTIRYIGEDGTAEGVRVLVTHQRDGGGPWVAQVSDRGPWLLIRPNLENRGDWRWSLAFMDEASDPRHRR